MAAVTSTGRTFRLASLVVPMLVVVMVTMGNARSSPFISAASYGLLALWTAVMVALVFRFLTARSTDEMPAPDIAHVDVLTAGGTSMMWTGALALVAANPIGWASLSVIGVLGIGVVQLSVLWTLVVAVGQGPWRGTRVVCEVVPGVAVEGDPLREQIRITDLRLPIGMRLFIVGRAQRHGVVSRYVVDARDAGREIRIEADIGPARRGEHRTPPLAMWFGDVLGLARTTVVHRGDATFRVVPKPMNVDGAPVLLGGGGEAAIARPVQHAPTDGTFRIREYVPGDDARRIHWVRSLQQNELVVRLPDELPPADPNVRLVLDNEMPAVIDSSGRSAHELLDTLVRLWLGVGKALAAGGTRVTLVTAARRDGGGGDGGLRVVERRIDGRSLQPALALGTAVTWQSGISLESLVSRQSNATQIVVSARPRYAGGAKHVRWVLVPETVWTTLEPTPPNFFDRAHELPFPVGSPENRKSRRGVARFNMLARWDDAAAFSQMLRWGDWKRFSGGFVALPDKGTPAASNNRAVVEVIA